jgi:hypothetical protein
MKTELKPPVVKRLKREYDDLLLSFAFKCNLRRYTGARVTTALGHGLLSNIFASWLAHGQSLTFSRALFIVTDGWVVLVVIGGLGVRLSVIGRAAFLMLRLALLN